MNNEEKRFLKIEYRKNEVEGMILEGYALKFNSPATHKFGEYEITEIITSEALNFTDMENVALRYNHNESNMLMASTRNKSLNLEIDKIGLKIIANLVNTQANRDLYKMVKSELITKMSFAFTIDKNGDKWEETKDKAKRTILNINKLYDVSIVDIPYYDSTEVIARNLKEISDIKKINLELEKQKILILEEFYK